MNPLTADSPISDTSVIADYIKSDLQSEAKQDMYDGMRYYRVKNDILNRKQHYYIGGIKHEDKSKSNNKIVHPFFRQMVKLKTNYITGQPITFNTDDDNFNQLIDDTLGDYFHDVSNRWVSDASIKGQSWLHPYINAKGEFKYTVIPSEQIIPIWDGSYQEELQGIIRYYTIDRVISNNKTIKRYKVEYWDNQKVTYFIQDEKDDNVYRLDDSELINPKYHWYSYNTLNPSAVIPNSWGKIPFIILENNDDCLSDLVLSRSLIDDYDKTVSDMSNNLDDIQEAIWVLKGYGGEDLYEFMQNLKAYKAISVDENGGAEAKSVTIPKEARDSHLDRLEENIYVSGMSVNFNSDKFGNSPSGIALKFMFANLDINANELITKAKGSLQEFLWFVTHYINLKHKTNYDYRNVNFTFHKSLIMNDTEIIDSAHKSVGIISNRSIREKHPWSASDEEQRIEEEKAAYVDLGDGNAGD
ncbi:phage portal protein [Paenibacillus sp. sgz302251]|uniref:phage portal protein n=1 Tax=Paenibacillus sp. sgz302251 TaxID=3414493 RepID=UPI003C7C1A93